MTLPQGAVGGQAAIVPIAQDPAPDLTSADVDPPLTAWYPYERRSGYGQLGNRGAILKPLGNCEISFLSGFLNSSSGPVECDQMNISSCKGPFAIRTISGDISLKGSAVHGAAVSGRGAITIEGVTMGRGGRPSSVMGDVRSAQGEVRLRGRAWTHCDLCARWVELTGAVTSNRLLINADDPNSREPWAWVSLSGPCTVKDWDFRGPATLVLDRVERGRLPDKLARHVELLDMDCPEDDAELARRLQLPVADAPFSSYRWGRLQYVLSLIGDPDASGRLTEVAEAWPDKAREAHSQSAALLWTWLESAPDQVADAFRRLDAPAMKRTIGVLRKAVGAFDDAPASDARGRALAVMHEAAAGHQLHGRDVWLPGCLVHAQASRPRWAFRPVDQLAARQTDVGGGDQDFALARRQFAASVKTAGRFEDWSDSRLADAAWALTQLERPAFLDHLAAEPPEVAEAWEREWAAGADQLAALLWRWLHTSPHVMLTGCLALDLRSLDAVVSALCRCALRNKDKVSADAQCTLAMIAEVAGRRGLPEWRDWVDLFRPPVDGETSTLRAWKNDYSTEPSTPLPDDIESLRALLAPPDPYATVLSDESWAGVQSLLGLLTSDALGRVGQSKRQPGAELIRRTFRQLTALVSEWMEQEPKEFLRRCQALDRASIERMTVLVCSGAIADGSSDEDSPFFDLLDRFTEVARGKRLRVARVNALQQRAEARSATGERWDTTTPLNGSAWDASLARHSKAYNRIAVALRLREPLPKPERGVSA